MLEMQNRVLVFEYPEVHPKAKLTVIFHRTLRIPDDGKQYPLPPSLGRFPVVHVDDFKEKVPEKWKKHGGVMLPMWQSEAMWMEFKSDNIPEHGHVWPFAIKVSTGKRSAVTGKPWSKKLREGDYCVVPQQKWLDGYVVEDGVIRQFVAAPLGMGATAEEQITGKAEFGGLQIEVYPMSKDEFEKRWPKLPPRMMPESRRILRSKSVSFNHESYSAVPCSVPCSGAGPTASLNVDLERGCEEVAECYSSNSINLFDDCREVKTNGVISPDMGLAPGGKMVQQVYADTFGVDVWDKRSHDRCFVHLANSLAWKAITGQDAPYVPLTAKDYSQMNFPWFDSYSDAPTVKVSSTLSNLKSAVQVGTETGVPIVLENESAQPKKIVHTGKKIRNGKWT